jgi:hypothetical protein
MTGLPVHQYGPACSGTGARFRTVGAGQSVAGAAVGIICIPGVKAILPGNIQNATTFDFPVAYRILEDVSFPEIACGDPSVTPKLIAAARDLVRQGARAIVGACGSFGHYQQPIAAAVQVPAYMSILTQVPNVLMGLGPEQKLLIVFANVSAYTDLVRQQCGIAEPDRIKAVGLSECEEFNRMFEADALFDPAKLVAEITATLTPHVTDEVGAILLQCSDLPPFAAAIQHQFGLPVHDMSGLIRWVQSSVVRTPFGGFM